MLDPKLHPHPEQRHPLDLADFESGGELTTAESMALATRGVQIEIPGSAVRCLFAKSGYPGEETAAPLTAVSLAGGVWLDPDPLPVGHYGRLTAVTNVPMVDRTDIARAGRELESILSDESSGEGLREILMLGHREKRFLFLDMVWEVNAPVSRMESSPLLWFNSLSPDIAVTGLLADAGEILRRELSALHGLRCGSGRASAEALRTSIEEDILTACDRRLLLGRDSVLSPPRPAGALVPIRSVPEEMVALMLNEFKGKRILDMIDPIG